MMKRRREKHTIRKREKRLLPDALGLGRIQNLMFRA
jgi:hypothetical protein